MDSVEFGEVAKKFTTVLYQANEFLAGIVGCTATVFFGSSAARLLQYSEMAAFRGKADAQTRNFNFPNLTVAYEGEADYLTALFMRR